MSYQFPPDVEQLIAAQLRLGKYQSEDEVLRQALHALAKRDEDVDAIAAGIEDMEAGRLKSLGDADRDLRASLGFPPRP